MTTKSLFTCSLVFVSGAGLKPQVSCMVSGCFAIALHPTLDPIVLFFGLLVWLFTLLHLQMSNVSLLPGIHLSRPGCFILSLNERDFVSKRYCLLILTLG